MSSTKADAVLRQLDRIKSVCDEAIRELGMSPQPIMQFFAPPISPQLMLFRAAYAREHLQQVLDRVPEPPEQPTSRARHIGATSEAGKQRIATDLSGKEPEKAPRKARKNAAEPEGAPAEAVS